MLLPAKFMMFSFCIIFQAKFKYQINYPDFDVIFLCIYESLLSGISSKLLLDE
jgi:hypothetical protein